MTRRSDHVEIGGLAVAENLIYLQYLLQDALCHCGLMRSGWNEQNLSRNFSIYLFKIHSVASILLNHQEKLATQCHWKCMCHWKHITFPLLCFAGFRSHVLSRLVSFSSQCDTDCRFSVKYFLHGRLRGECSSLGGSYEEVFFFFAMEMILWSYSTHVFSGHPGGATV